MTEDEVLDLTVEVEERYGIHLTLTEAKLLRFLMRVKTATDSAIDFEVWPEVDPFDRNLAVMRKVYIHRLRKKFGQLIKLVNYWVQGYALKRLGPPENPMHERK